MSFWKMCSVLALVAHPDPLGLLVPMPTLEDDPSTNSALALPSDSTRKSRSAELSLNTVSVASIKILDVPADPARIVAISILPSSVPSEASTIRASIAE